MMKPIIIQRVYDHKEADDNYRILVDRLWPRGIRKEDLQIDEWNKELAPSVSLRKWFNHQADRFDEFARHYKEELLIDTEKLERVRKIAEKQQVTLLYGAKDPKINHAIVLCEVLNASVK